VEEEKKVGGEEAQWVVVFVEFGGSELKVKLHIWE
jgi:hypothetical protein